MAEASSSSSSVSVYASRRFQRAQRYLAGVARAPHRLEPDLQSILVSPDSSLVLPEDADDDPTESVTSKRARRETLCSRGCHTVLSRLAITYNKVGVHTGKTSQYRRSSYPNPKKGAPPRNLTSKVTFCPPCIVFTYIL
jgi:hypothetical protein